MSQRRKTCGRHLHIEQPDISRITVRCLVFPLVVQLQNVKYFLCHLLVVPLFFDSRLPLGEIQKIIELNFSLPGNIDVPVVQQKYSHICSRTTFGTGCDQSQRCPLTVCELYQIDTSQ